MTSQRSYRITLLGDYSNLHSQLGRTLRTMGHEVTVVSAGSGFQDTVRDVNIHRYPGKIGGAILTLDTLYGPLNRHLKGNDIVVLQNPNFLTLKPRRLRYIFDRLKGENRSVFLTCGGTDPRFLRECLDASSRLEYSEFRINGHPGPFALEQPDYIRRYTTSEMCAFCDYVYDNIDGAVTALYEYDVAARRYLGDEKTAYGGLPIDTDRIKFTPMEADPECVRLFLGRHRGRLVEKGTDLLEEASLRVCRMMPGRVELKIVENLPYSEYIDTMCSSHILLDQIYSYTPATNALIGMAHGLCVVSGGEADFYDFIGEKDNRPILNAPTDVDGLTELLAEACSRPENLAERGRRSREFVMKHNESRKVAQRYLDFWESKLK